jgi:hypothetical protein
LYSLQSRPKIPSIKLKRSCIHRRFLTLIPNGPTRRQPLRPSPCWQARHRTEWMRLAWPTKCELKERLEWHNPALHSGENLAAGESQIRRLATSRHSVRWADGIGNSERMRHRTLHLDGIESWCKFLHRDANSDFEKEWGNFKMCLNEKKIRTGSYFNRRPNRDEFMSNERTKRYNPRIDGIMWRHILY